MIRVYDKVIDLDKPVGRLTVVDLICPKRAWYLYNEPVRELVRSTDELVIVGVETHGLVLSQLREQGCRVEVPIDVEVECDGQRHVRRFRVDAVCDDKIIEIKKKYTKELAPLYIWQVKVYMALLGVHRGAIVSLLDGYVKEIEAGEDELKVVKERLIENIRKVLCGGDVSRHVGKWCRYCRYKDTCLNERLM